MSQKRNKHAAFSTAYEGWRRDNVGRAIFEATFEASFPKVRPETLRSASGRLELDGHSRQKKIAFEYQGPHHYSNAAVQAHDALKREWCKSNGVRLIEVEATGGFETVEHVRVAVVDRARDTGQEAHRGGTLIPRDGGGQPGARRQFRSWIETNRRLRQVGPKACER